MDADKHKRIEERAYAVWEAEGHPHGRHEEHWRLALRQIEAEESAPSAMKQKKRRSANGGSEGGRSESREATRKKSKK